MNSEINKRIQEYTGDDELWPHEKKAVMYDILLRTTSGEDAAAVSVRGSGHPFTGIEWFQPVDEPLTMTYRRGPRQWLGARQAGEATLLTPPGSVPGWGRSVPDPAYETPYDTEPGQRPGRYCSWDCREWQMWRGRPFGLEMRPRRAPADSGCDLAGDRIRVWSQYEVDGVRTRQCWLFADVDDGDAIQYDCLMSLENVAGEGFVEYSQFFADYTEVNGLNGCYFWHGDTGELVNFLDLFVFHLQAFVVDPGSPFLELNSIPHFPRTEGLINATWRFPLMVGHATDRGWRHVILAEPEYAAGISCGMKGVAMDYVLYPGRLRFEAGERFTAHIRHLAMRRPELPGVSELEQLQQRFESEHVENKDLAVAPELHRLE